MTKPDFRAERELRARGFGQWRGSTKPDAAPRGSRCRRRRHPRSGKLPRGLNDSKQLTSGERDRLYHEILLHASAVSVAFASAAEIDQINIRQATFLAMRRALFALSATPNYALIDAMICRRICASPPRRSSRAML